MAISCSSMVFTITASSSSLLKPKIHRNSVYLSSSSTFVHNQLSSSHQALVSTYRSLPRKLYRVQAAVLQEDEEKVVVEESFQPKSFPDDEAKQSSEEPSESPPSSVVEKWVINFQSPRHFLFAMEASSFEHGRRELRVV